MVASELDFWLVLQWNPFPDMDGPSNGQIITATSDFETFWKNVAGRFKSNSRVIFDTSKSIIRSTSLDQRHVPPSS